MVTYPTDIFIRQYWSRTRQLPLIWGVLVTMLALVWWLRGGAATPLFGWLSVAAAVAACALAWRHRRLVDQAAPLRALFVSWTMGWLMCSSVILLAGWVSHSRFGWGQLVFHFAAIAYPWTEARSH
jgi:hypothetical protein